MTIEWNDSLTTGVEAVDHQHKELIDRAAKLERALDNNDNDEVKNMIVFLEDYVIEHFRDEEELMQKHNYPDYPLQKNAHDLFVDTFNEIKKEFEAAGITDSLKEKLKVNMNTWLLRHIHVMDKKLGEYMQEKESSQAL